jgi:hypothetical protein
MYDWHTKFHTADKLPPSAQAPLRRGPRSGAAPTRPPTWTDAWDNRPPPGLIRPMRPLPTVPTGSVPAATPVHHVYRFLAAIRRSGAGAAQDDPLGGTAPPVGATRESATTPDGRSVATATSEPKEGETIRLPDIVPEDAGDFAFVQADPVMPSLYYAAHIKELKQANSCPMGPNGWGVAGLTTPFRPSVIHISVTPVLGWYYVDATLDETITVQVCDGVGPQGQVDITSENDPSITKENYLQVAQDLTPNAGGLPARNMFYARDISLSHENFHASDWVAMAQKNMPAVEKWLTGKWAASVDSVNWLLVDMSKQFMKIIYDKYAPEAEVRAYADGKSRYQKLATAITAKGDAGKYPPWDWKKGLP